MRHIIEEYGEAILQALGGIGVLAVLIDLLSSDGMLHKLVVRILESGC